MITCAIRHLEAFSSGVEETMTTLLVKAPVISVGTALSAGIGYLAAGSLAAYTAAKVCCCLLSVFYGLCHPQIAMPETTFRFAGNIAPILIPPIFFLIG